MDQNADVLNGFGHVQLPRIHGDQPFPHRHVLQGGARLDPARTGGRGDSAAISASLVTKCGPEAG
jgi:hypothetical protein